MTLPGLTSIASRVQDLRTMRWQWVHGEPELHLVPLLGDRSRDFVDVGANHGIWSLAARGHFRRTQAFEANPDVADALRARLGRRTVVHPCALSDHQGEATLWIPSRDGREVDTRSSLLDDANPGYDLRPVSVGVRPLDGFGLSDVALLKVDVEGHELAVLRGARSTIRSSLPVCVVETEERHGAGGPARVFAFFEDLGFEGWFLDHGRLRPVADFRLDVHQRPESAKSPDGAQPTAYVNNFVFSHPDWADAFAPVRAAYT